MSLSNEKISKEYTDIYEDKVIQDIMEPRVSWVLGVLLFFVVLIVALLVYHGVLL